jgi:hypothetical protein
VRALQLAQKHGDLEHVLEALAAPGSKHQVPENYPYQEARQLFLQPRCAPGWAALASGLRWGVGWAAPAPALERP